jgi:hypothetical protein
MKRHVLGLLAVLASAALVRADALVPPPQGKKHVAVTHSVKLDKGISGYLFFTRPLGPRNSPTAKIELSADKAVPLPGGKFGLQLLAVPDAVAKKYATEKELLAALSDKLDGVASASFDRIALLPEKDERKELALEHVITGFDKKSIQMQDKSDAPKAPDKEESMLAPTGTRLVIGGLVGTAALVTGGLWLVRRRRVGGATR